MNTNIKSFSKNGMIDGIKSSSAFPRDFKTGNNFDIVRNTQNAKIIVNKKPTQIQQSTNTSGEKAQNYGFSEFDYSKFYTQNTNNENIDPQNLDKKEESDLTVQLNSGENIRQELESNFEIPDLPELDMKEELSESLNPELEISEKIQERAEEVNQKSTILTEEEREVLAQFMIKSSRQKTIKKLYF